MTLFSRLLLIFSASMFLLACDPNHEKKCEWFLVPEPKNMAWKMEKGYIPVCARNYELNKQNCKLKAKYTYAKRVYGKKFRLVDMKVKGSRFPKEVQEIKLCKED